MTTLSCTPEVKQEDDEFGYCGGISDEVHTGVYACAKSATSKSCGLYFPPGQPLAKNGYIMRQSDRFLLEAALIHQIRLLKIKYTGFSPLPNKPYIPSTECYLGPALVADIREAEFRLLTHASKPLSHAYSAILCIHVRQN